MTDLRSLARRHNALRQRVVDWMAAEGAHGNLRQNADAPDWNAYVAAQRELNAAIAAEGTEE